MLKKVYENIKGYIKENHRELILILSFYVAMTYPLPYFILVSGGTIDVSDRVEIENSYEQKGSFNLAYVNELRGTLPTVLLSYVIPNWTLYEESDYVIDETEDVHDIAERDRLSLIESQQNSAKVAYLAAKKDFTIKESGYYVFYIYDFVKEYSDLRVGDRLLSYDGNQISDIEKYREYINTKNVDDEIELVYKRGDKEKKTKLRVYEEDGSKYTGIMITTIYDYATTPSIKFNFSKNESGSSGGLTLALAIYNKLTATDITRGLKIVGTGTIEQDGTVGEIGGVEYKLKGAVKSKADVFIVPTGDNYKEAKKLKEKYNYKIDLIEATTFEETLVKLDNYTKNHQKSN